MSIGNNRVDRSDCMQCKEKAKFAANPFIYWVHRVKNEHVPRSINTELQLIHTVQTRKLEHLGHIMRNPKYELLQLIIQGNIQGK